MPGPLNILPGIKLLPQLFSIHMKSKLVRQVPPAVDVK